MYCNIIITNIIIYKLIKNALPANDSRDGYVTNPTLDIEQLPGAEGELERILEWTEMMIDFRGEKGGALLMWEIFIFVQDLRQIVEK